MTDESTTEPADGDGTAEKPDLLRGWNWGLLLTPVIAEHLPADFNAEEYAATLDKDMAPLLDVIEKTLENRPNEATVDERVLALEKKILLLRQAHELLLGVALTWAWEAQKARRRSGSSARSRARTKADPDPAAAELAQLRARRLRLLGQ